MHPLYCEELPVVKKEVKNGLIICIKDDMYLKINAFERLMPNKTKHCFLDVANVNQKINFLGEPIWMPGENIYHGQVSKDLYESLNTVELFQTVMNEGFSETSQKKVKLVRMLAGLRQNFLIDKFPRDKWTNAIIDITSDFETGRIINYDNRAKKSVILKGSAGGKKKNPPSLWKFLEGTLCLNNTITMYLVDNPEVQARISDIPNHPLRPSGSFHEIAAHWSYVLEGFAEFGIDLEPWAGDFA